MILILLAVEVLCDAHAVLIAGSRTWMNYRHQADISAIYQMLTQNGMKRESITQFQFDDIADNEENGFHGAVFHDLDHVDVYPGKDTIDFRSNEVTAEKLYQFLESMNTTKNDNILIYYDNHGGPGTLYVPNSPKDSPIYGDELNEVLQKMYDNGKYGKILFVIEACESGSLINFMKAPNILVMTASGPAEESKSIVYDPVVDNMLSNEFTYNLINIINENPTAEIEDIFSFVLKSMNGSTPMISGDETISKMRISDFFGYPLKKSHLKTKRIMKRKHDLIPQRKVQSHLLKKKLEKSNEGTKSLDNARTELLRIESETTKLQNAIRELATALNLDIRKFPLKYTNIPSHYFDVLRHFILKYGGVEPDDMGLLSDIVHICTHRTKSDIISAINILFN